MPIIEGLVGGQAGSGGGITSITTGTPLQLSVTNPSGPTTNIDFIGAGSGVMTITPKAISYTLTQIDAGTLIFVTATRTTQSLPTAPTTGSMFNISLADDVALCTIDVVGGIKTIGGLTSLTLSNSLGYRVIYNGTNYTIL